MILVVLRAAPPGKLYHSILMLLCILMLISRLSSCVCSRSLCSLAGLVILPCTTSRLLLRPLLRQPQRPVAT